MLEAGSRVHIKYIMFFLFLILIIVLLSYRISLWFLYFPIICWKSQCYSYFIVCIKHDYFNVFFWQLHYLDPLWFCFNYLLLLWFRITLSCFLICLVSFDWVVDIVYKSCRNNSGPRQCYFHPQRICFAFSKCLGRIILRELQSNSELRWSNAELESLLDHFYFCFPLIPRE